MTLRALRRDRPVTLGALAAVLLGVVAGILVMSRLMPTKSPAAEASPGDVAATVVLLTATPGLRFDGQIPGPTIRVPLGTEVRLILANNDSLSHDLWIVAAGERAPYLQPVFPGAKTRMVVAGEQEEIRFIPDRSALFKYVCTVPGHDDAMFGRFIVEARP